MSSEQQRIMFYLVLVSCLCNNACPHIIEHYRSMFSIGTRVLGYVVVRNVECRVQNPYEHMTSCNLEGPKCECIISVRACPLVGLFVGHIGILP